MDITEHFCLIRRSVEYATIPERLVARRILVNLIRCLWWQTQLKKKSIALTILPKEHDCSVKKGIPQQNAYLHFYQKSNMLKPSSEVVQKQMQLKMQLTTDTLPNLSPTATVS